MGLKHYFLLKNYSLNSLSFSINIYYQFLQMHKIVCYKKVLFQATTILNKLTDIYWK
jgi:hypothetical protein